MINIEDLSELFSCRLFIYVSCVIYINNLLILEFLKMFYSCKYKGKYYLNFNNG